MLIGHYAVQPRLVGHCVLLMVLVIEMMGLFRVEVGVGEIQPPGVVLRDVVHVQVGIGLLGMEKDFHRVFHNFSPSIRA